MKTFWEAAAMLRWKSLACLIQKVRLNCFNIYESIYESWPWDLCMWHPLTSVGGDLCLKQIYFWKETCVATIPFCGSLSWRAFQLDWFCFLAECQFIFITGGRTQLCILSVTSEMFYFKWFLVLKLGKLILLDLAVSKFVDLIFMLFPLKD